jgi:predicted type IV restriction endonuclease
MPRVPSKVANRIRAGLKRFQPIIANAKARDVNESDTVTIVMELLSEIFGYDKFLEITSEHAIRGTFCDLAIKLDGELTMLVEVKAAGADPKSIFIKQAVDYAANQGVDWVILTNGDLWHVYKLTFSKPIDAELVARVCISECDPKNDEHIESLWMVSKEGWSRSALDDHHARGQAFNRFTLAAVVVSEPVLTVIRRELRKASPDIRLANEEIENLLLQEVIKRDVVEGDKAVTAKRSIARATKRSTKMTVTTTAAVDPPASEIAGTVAITGDSPPSNSKS